MSSASTMEAMTTTDGAADSLLVGVQQIRARVLQNVGRQTQTRQRKLVHCKRDRNMSERGQRDLLQAVCEGRESEGHTCNDGNACGGPPAARNERAQALRQQRNWKQVECR